MRTADYYCGDCIPRARTNVEGSATSSIYSWYLALDATLAQDTSSQSDSFNSSYGFGIPHPLSSCPWVPDL